ncbi:PerC family transcriptional regulator, partial [Escherichia coli]
MITDKKAEELEQRGLWRRAAARWQELLLNYLQEDDRICIQRRIQHCLKRAKMKSQRATSQEEFSFRLLRSSAIQTEKEMGIYRDRKTEHDHLYRQDGKKSPQSLYIDLCNCLILICSIQHQMKVNVWT